MYAKLLKPIGSIIGLAGIAVSIRSGYAEAVSRPLSRDDAGDRFKVAVIGSGIGGSSAAYFIRNLLGSGAIIDVFEKDNRIGGRMAVVEIENNTFEAGASIIHESNKYMTNFCELGGFGKLKDDTTSSMGIYNGDEFAFLSTGYSLIDKIKLFWRYGMGLLRMDRFTSSTVEKFKEIYKLQDEGISFETVHEFLKTLGGDDFIELTKKSARKALLDDGVSERIIDELATAVTRCNYGQDMNVNAFTGFVSLAGAQSSKLWAVKGGNFQACKYALEAANANVRLNAKVTAVSKHETEANKVKYSLTTNGIDSDNVYDVVVVAVPLEVKSTQVECKACEDWPTKMDMGRYQRTVATFVAGRLNPAEFGLSSEKEIPADIFTSESPKLAFSSIGEQKNVEGKTVENVGRHVYKIFSRDSLTEEQLNKLFVERTKVNVVDWLAYPHYTPPERLGSFKLDDGVFYVNAIERVASAMEMGAIGGRNAALLTARYLTGGTAPTGRKNPRENVKAEF